MPDRRRVARLLCVAILATLACTAACRGGSASETKIHRYVVGVSGMT